MSKTSLSLRDWAALAEIVAAVAVIFSLVYLGAEVRQNTNAIQGVTYQGIIDASGEYLLTIAGDSSLAAIMARASEDPSALSPGEFYRYFSLVRVYWRNMENAYLQHGRGVLGEEEWDVYARIICTSKSGFESTWTWHMNTLNPGFRSFVESC